MRVLVIGSGGREHALCWKIAQSPLVETLYCTPGNAGTAQTAQNVAMDDPVAWAQENRIGLVVVGPEAPLVGGLGDRLNTAGIPCFGSGRAAARLEGSKAFAKEVMAAGKIPTAAYAEFKDAESAKAYIRERGAPVVLKADGLAAGKGVIVAETLDAALAGADALQAYGCHLIVEEFLEGPELSFFALCDGKQALALTSVQDHKRVGDGDTGPNTGGMGAFSPTPYTNADLHGDVMGRVVQPTLDVMARRGTPFAGVLFVGLMLTAKGPRVLEYNIRFGDPECQVLMLRMKSDIVPLLFACAQGDVSGRTVEWHDGAALTVVMASKGYPGLYDKGTAIASLPMDQDDLTVFHAGTADNAAGQLVATGGRVLNITAKGKDVKTAQKRAYDAIRDVNWPNGFYRSDIAAQAVSGADG